MAEESPLSNSRPDSKRKFDDGPPPPASYNSVPPPLDGIQLAKLRAQEIASKIFNEVEAKRPKVDNGASGDDHVQKFLGQQVPSQTGMAQATSFFSYGYGTSKKIEIPNGRVGVIIGKSGDTIKYLQQQSGAKIQVARDTEVNPHSPTRPVELTGTADQIDRAEQLINEVLAEADAGGSGAIANRKFGVTQPGSDHFSMKVANNKVGLIIGKGGETIKNMQANSGARIQVIPLHLPPGDISTERTVHIDGTPEQIEAAKKLVNEIVNSENRTRNSQMGGTYPQQSYRPPRPPVSWGPPGPPPTMQQPGYGYMQPGSYPGATPQYMSQPYGGYQAQPPAPGGYPSNWDQTSAQGAQQTTTGTGYDYYNQQQQPTSAPSDNTGYNYGQPPPVYGSQGSYGDASNSQLATGQQQSYSQDYSGGYNTQGQQSGYSQPAATSQAGYDQQSYGSGAAYVEVSSNQDGSTLTYGSSGGTTPALPSQQAPSVQPSPSQQGYGSQPPSAVPTTYPPQGAAQSGYGGVPPASQPGYGESAALTQPGYGQSLQAQNPPATQAVYGQHPTSQAGYAAPSQPGYGQPLPAQSAYGQPYHQVPPYSGAPAAAQAGYGQQQPYGDSYGSGGYSQPPQPYGSEGGAAPAATGGATKASPHG